MRGNTAHRAEGNGAPGGTGGSDNFITLMAGAMGIKRDDKLKAMSSMKEFKDVTNYLSATIHNSPYPYEAGVSALKAFLNL